MSASSPRKQELPIYDTHARTQRNSDQNSVNSHRSSFRPLPNPRSDQHPNKGHRRGIIAENFNRKAIKCHFVAASGEFIGTMMFLYFGFATHIMSILEVKPGEGVTPQTVVFVSLGYGFSLLVTVWVWYRISGGLFNPAVTLGLILSGCLPPVRGLILFPAQILGAIAAAGLVEGMFPGPISLVNTTLRTGTSITQGLFIEMFLTCLLIITVLMLAAEKSKDTFIAPVGIGLALFVAEIAGLFPLSYFPISSAIFRMLTYERLGVFYTGGSLNPARSFGPAVVSGVFPTYHWIYWVGPGMAGVLTTGYFRLVKALNYEEANPGQDSAGGDLGHNT
ncbi:hypothetical protein HYALB_00011520 [Hymenoscyphus albidus]|uniref:Aquaporin-like protein n=1 Tax=Hymenoscyphus albidus TaxID=595503 RepID=A0A9N9QA23_9HELO|nr:hypothetical protein HYALB_00011520 [Hymenoscyphus albidus]